MPNRGLYPFRSIIYKLGQADPSKLNHEEKLAFWINVHNALVMHVRIKNPLLHFLYQYLSLIKNQVH